MPGVNHDGDRKATSRRLTRPLRAALLSVTLENARDSSGLLAEDPDGGITATPIPAVAHCESPWASPLASILRILRTDVDEALDSPRKAAEVAALWGLWQETRRRR